MAKRMVEESSLQMVADAIREKAGTEETLVFPEEFAAAIGKISGGGTDEVDAILSGTVTEIHNDRITELGSQQWNTGLVAVHVPNVGKTVQGCFARCSSLTTVDMPKLKFVENTAFQFCTALKKLVLYLTGSVGSAAFSNCTNLEYLDLGAPTSVSVQALRDTALNKLVIRSETVATLANVNALGNTPIANGTGYIYVPDDLVDSYKVATNWITFADQFRPMSELEVA